MTEQPIECRYCGEPHDVDHECEPAERRVLDVARYDEACRRAATDQGLDPITARLTAEQIPHDVDQTGGFTMCVRVDRPDGWYAYVTAEAGRWLVGAYSSEYDTPEGCEGVMLDGGQPVTPDAGVALVQQFRSGEIGKATR